MQHCQQAPVSNEFSTAVLADSIAAKGGKLFIQYYSLPRIRHGHSLPQHHLVRWTLFSLFDLVSLVYYLIEEQNVLYLCERIPLLVSPKC